MNKLTSLTTQELEAILITCDGQGKEVKKQALQEIIDRIIVRENLYKE